MSLVRMENGNAVLEPSIASKIAEFERKVKEIKEQEDELKKAILAAMEENMILSLDTPELRISYVAATDRETFDSKAFRKDHPDLYDEYIRMSPVNASIRIKTK